MGVGRALVVQASRLLHKKRNCRRDACTTKRELQAGRLHHKKGTAGGTPAPQKGNCRRDACTTKRELQAGRLHHKKGTAGGTPAPQKGNCRRDACTTKRLGESLS